MHLFPLHETVSTSDIIPKIMVVRRQSQRCPDKILRPFAGEKSLLDIALEKYRGRPDVFIAGHEPIFAEIATRYGIGFIQRSEASAHAEDALTVHEYLRELPYEHICFVGVCAPFLKAETVDAAVEKYASDPAMRSLFGVRAVYDIIFKPDGSLIAPETAGLNSKEKRPSWIGTNSVYVFERQRFLSETRYWDYAENDPHLFPVPDNESPDVDTEEDFRLCQALYQMRHASHSTTPTTMPETTHEAFQAFWRSPDAGNQPECYVQENVQPRSTLLRHLAERHTSPDRAVLEIGCNAGRNLNTLYGAGYRDLYGIEIREEAAACLRQTYPKLAASLKLSVAPVEDVIRSYADGQFGLVFTMAVLAHIHPDVSSSVFEEIARVAGNVLITIEDESGDSWKHVPRCYKDIFENLGFEEIESLRCSPQEHALPEIFVARVFYKKGQRV